MNEARAKPPEGSLDWWMQTADSPEPTDEERDERARLVFLIVETWDTARKPWIGIIDQKPKNPIESGLPANQLCGNLLDAAAELLSMPRDRVVTVIANWAEQDRKWLKIHLQHYFHDTWTR
jgi:hypothetical protein